MQISPRSLLNVFARHRQRVDCIKIGKIEKLAALFARFTERDSKIYISRDHRLTTTVFY